MKYYLLDEVDHLHIEQTDDYKYPYKIYTTDSHIIFLLLSIPLMGNILSLIIYIQAINDKKEIPNKKEKKIKTIITR